MMCRAFYIGRFQPLHKGHVHAIKYILSNCEEIIIGIGSAQLSYSLKNPFTTGERMTMIRLALIENSIPLEKVWIIPIPDINNNNLWVSHVEALSPNFNVVFSNNSLVKLLFERAGYKVNPIPFIQRNEFSATHIRNLMLTNGNWKELVPKSVSEFIEKIDGVKRLQKLSKRDE